MKMSEYIRHCCDTRLAGTWEEMYDSPLSANFHSLPSVVMNLDSEESAMCIPGREVELFDIINYASGAEELYFMGSDFQVSYGTYDTPAFEANQALKFMFLEFIACMYESQGD